MHAQLGVSLLTQGSLPFRSTPGCRSRAGLYWRRELPLRDLWGSGCRHAGYECLAWAATRGTAGAGRQTKKENIQFRPLCDGVFRAVPPTVNAKEFCGKILQQVPQLLSNLIYAQQVCMLSLTVLPVMPR